MLLQIMFCFSAPVQKSISSPFQSMVAKTNLYTQLEKLLEIERRLKFRPQDLTCGLKFRPRDLNKSNMAVGVWSSMKGARLGENERGGAAQIERKRRRRHCCRFNRFLSWTIFFLGSICFLVFPLIIAFAFDQNN